MPATPPLSRYFLDLERRLSASLPAALTMHYRLIQETGTLDADAVHCAPLLPLTQIDDALRRIDILRRADPRWAQVPPVLPILPGEGRQLCLLVLAEGWDHPVGMVVSLWTDTLDTEPLLPLSELLADL